MTENKMVLMKPHPDACQVCAREHEAHLPHDQQSLYYRMTFHAQHGRYPTWADAMAHCSPSTNGVAPFEITESPSTAPQQTINTTQKRRKSWI